MFFLFCQHFAFKKHCKSHADDESRCTVSIFSHGQYEELFNFNDVINIHPRSSPSTNNIAPFCHSSPIKSVWL